MKINLPKRSVPITLSTALNKQSSFGNYGFSKTMRLTYALWYASIQGRTLKDKHILLLDTMHRDYFTMRHLIVGMSRATHGQYVHLPTLSAESALCRRATRSVRDSS